MTTLLARSDSRSTTTSNGEGGIDELCALFAAGHVEPIVQGLLAMRAALTQASPDTVHTTFSDALPEMLAAASAPFALVLQLLDEPALAQRGAAAGGKVDLRTLLVRALRSVCASERMHSKQLWPQADSSNGSADASASVEPATPPPADLTPELTAKARAMLLRGTYLNPRAYEAVKSLYRVEMSDRELLAYARACYDAGNYRDCAEFLKAFNITADEPTAEEIARGASPLDGFPHAALMMHLSSDKAQMDAFIAYLTQSPAFLAKHVKAALTNLAEVSGGNDANLAAKLAARFGVPLTSIPRVLYLKRKDIIWWISRIGKAVDFGVELAGNDSGLQRKLLRELTRSKSPADRLTACSFLELWPQQMAAEQEYREFYAAHAKTRREQIASGSVPPTAEEVGMANLQRAIALWQEQEQQREAGVALPADGSLFLPALPSPPELPQLFLRPDSIVIVDSMDSLTIAREHLLSPRTTVIGLDLEHLPENFVGLDLRPTLCQWLQIACDSKAFLFDLQLLHKPTRAEREKAAATAAAEAKAAAASSGGIIRNGMRALPSTSSSSPSPVSPLERLFPVLPSTSSAPPPFDPLFRDGVNDLLLELFTNEDLLKVGIGFAQDMRKLRMDFGPEVSTEAPMPASPSHAQEAAASAPCDECEVDNGVLAFQITLQNYVGLEPLLKLVADPDAEQREGQRRKQAQEAKRKAAEKKKAQKKGPSASPPPAAATATATAASSPPPAPKPGGLSSLFGDDDDAEDDDVAEAGAAAGLEAEDAANAVAPSPSPPAAAAAAAASSAASSGSAAAVLAPSFDRSSGGGYTHQAKKEGGLSKLVRMMLRRTLDKSEQISNWSAAHSNSTQTNGRETVNVGATQAKRATRSRGS